MKNISFFRFFLYAVSAFAFIFQSCSKNTIHDLAPPAEKDDLAALARAVAASNGVPAEKVVYGESEKEFVIDGDALVSLEDAKIRFSSLASGEAGVTNSTTQMKSYYKVSDDKAKAIKVYADATVPSFWITALDSAIKNWNTCGSKVYIQRITTATGATTKITTTYTTSATVATASYPNSYGAPGVKVTINTYHNGLAASKKIFAITHELGHTLGLSHTNGTYGSLITGTPTTDASSVMNAVCLYWSGFTAYDLKAIRALYPL